MSQRRRTPATEYFGAELRRTREEANISRAKLGNLSGYVAGTIAQFEIGERFPQERFVAWRRLLLRRSQPFYQLPGVDLEPFGEPEDVVQADVPPAPLHLADVRPVQATVVGELFLAPAELVPSAADPLPERPSRG